MSQTSVDETSRLEFDLKTYDIDEKVFKNDPDPESSVSGRDAVKAPLQLS